MWISRKEFDALADKVAKLEKRQDETERNFPDSTHITVFKDYGIYYWPSIGHMKSERIKISTIIYRILDKLGLDLKYQDGSPAKVEITDKPKKAKK